MDIYNYVYMILYKIANFQVAGILFCRMMAPVVLIVLIWFSRVIQSVTVKFMSIAVALLLYFFPAIVNIFAPVGF